MSSPQNQSPEPPVWIQIIMFGIIPLGVISLIAVVVMAGVEMISVIFNLPYRPITALVINPETDSIASRDN